MKVNTFKDLFDSIDIFKEKGLVNIDSAITHLYQMKEVTEEMEQLEALDDLIKKSVERKTFVEDRAHYIKNCITFWAFACLDATIGKPEAPIEYNVIPSDVK